MRRFAYLSLTLALASCSSPPAPAPDTGTGGTDAGDDASATDADRPDTGPRPDAAVVHPMTDEPLKGPFVMQPTTTSVVVRWETVLAPASADVDYQPEAGGTMATATGTSTLTHVLLEYRGARDNPDIPGDYYVNQVTVTGLTPATCYTYSIGGYPAYDGRFCTAHLPSDHTTPIRIYAIGDTSPAIMNTLRILSHTAPDAHEFTIHVGDLQYYSTIVESQQLWFELMRPLLGANAFMPCEGNHESEIDHELDDIYGRLFDHPGGAAGGVDDTTWWYHFESGGVHFISLSTERDLSATSAQGQWFEATMDRIEAEAGYRFTIVYFHRPIYGVASYQPNLWNRSAIEQVINTHRVPLVLAGHMHNYERFQVGNTTHVTTGAGGFSDPASTIDDLVTTLPADAALRVASGAYLQAMTIEIVPDTGVPGGDVIQCEILDEMGMARDTFEIHVPPP